MAAPDWKGLNDNNRKLIQASVDAAKKSDHLKHGGNGGNYGGMDAVDAKIAAAEARTDTKFAQVLARLDSIEKSTSGLRLNTWLAAATALGLAIAVVAFGSTQYGNGIMVTTAAVNDAVEAKRIAVENATEVKGLREDFSAFVKAFETSRMTDQQSGGDIPEGDIQFAK